MLLAEVFAILMVAAVIAALMAGYPVALTLAGVSLIFAMLGHILGAMGLGILGALPQRIFGVMTNETDRNGINADRAPLHFNDARAIS